MNSSFTISTIKINYMKKSIKFIVQICPDCFGDGGDYGFDGWIPCKTCLCMGKITPSHKKFKNKYKSLKQLTTCLKVD